MKNDRIGIEFAVAPPSQTALLGHNESLCQRRLFIVSRGEVQSEDVQEMAFAFDTQGAQVIVNDPFIDHDERAGTRWTFLPVAAGAAL